MAAPRTADGALAATSFIDVEAPEVREFVDRTVPPGSTPVEAAVALYYAVRDGLRYEIYGADLSREGLRAGSVARAGTGLCLHKSVLFVAALRAVGVPARLGLADVRNHLTSDRMQTLIGGDVFRHHAYAAVWLDGRWVRATPVFSRLLCRLYRLTPLEFDGTADSLHHPYDLDGRRHMEFVRVHGEFDDVPYERILTDLRAAHPLLLDASSRVVPGSLVRDATGAAP